MLVLVLFPVAYRQSRLYATNRIRTHLEEVFELFKATITASLFGRTATLGSPLPVTRADIRLLFAVFIKVPRPFQVKALAPVWFPKARIGRASVADPPRESCLARLNGLL